MCTSPNQRKAPPILRKTTEIERKKLVSYNNYVDPEVTKISNQIHNAIEKHKPIKPSGIRAPELYPESKPSSVNIEKEAVAIDMIDANTLEEIKKIAAQHPLTKDLMSQAKHYFQENQKIINKQMEELVAL